MANLRLRTVGKDLQLMDHEAAYVSRRTRKTDKRLRLEKVFFFFLGGGRFESLVNLFGGLGGWEVRKGELDKLLFFSVFLFKYVFFVCIETVFGLGLANEPSRDY